MNQILVSAYFKNELEILCINLSCPLLFINRTAWSHPILLCFIEDKCSAQFCPLVEAVVKKQQYYIYFEDFWIGRNGYNRNQDA